MPLKREPDIEELLSEIPRVYDPLLEDLEVHFGELGGIRALYHGNLPILLLVHSFTLSLCRIADSNEILTRVALEKRDPF